MKWNWKNMTQDKPLCYAPFIGLYAASTKNEYAPCCVAKKEKFLDPESYWNSDRLKEIRTQMLNHEWPDVCSYCKNKSEKNLKNDIYIWDNAYKKSELESVNVETGNINNSPLFLDYRPSNTCNLKCRMCVPAASSQWSKEIEDNPELTRWYTVPKFYESSYQSFLNYMEKCNLEQIKILGGEPTIDPYAIEFLEKVLDTHTKLPSLRFTTNATNLNKRFQNIMKRFENIHVVFSIDAVDNTFDYIRTNANWKKVKKQVEAIFEKDLATQYGFNTVVMPYNMFNLVDLLSWYRDLYLKGYKFSVFFDTSDVAFTGTSAILPEDLEIVKESVTNFINTCDDGFKNLEGISDLIKILDKTKFNEASFNEFKTYNNTLDRIRKTNLLSLNERFNQYV